MKGNETGKEEVGGWPAVYEADRVFALRKSPLRSELNKNAFSDAEDPCSCK